MALHSITTDQFRTARQSIQSRYIKLELLNYQFQTVDELQGVATSGAITIDANSDVRRTASISLVVKNSSFEVETGGKIWLDKFIRINVGTYNLIEQNISWVNCGTYIIDAPSYEYDPSTNTLDLTLYDLMAKLTGLRNGYLEGIPVTLKAGENIRKAIIGTLALGGFTKYIVEEAPGDGKIPNDLEFNQGTTIYDLLAGLRDIYPNYEIFFDVDGTFYYKPIPTGLNDPVLVDDSTFDKLVTSESINVDFQNVKNSIEVYGRTHDPAHFSTSTSVSGSVVTLTIADVIAYSDGVVYGFTLTNNTGISNLKIRINSLATLDTYDDNGNAGKIEAESGEVYYCVQYNKSKNKFYYLGHLQAYAKVEDTNPDSPFNVNGTIGRIRLPLFDGEYDNYLTDNLAKQRADYELWLHTNMNDTLTLSMTPIYWLDVNIKANYTLKRNNQNRDYLIKSISIGLAPTDAMSVQMARFYART